MSLGISLSIAARVYKVWKILFNIFSFNNILTIHCSVQRSKYRAVIKSRLTFELVQIICYIKLTLSDIDYDGIWQ